jgi:hypothetical protein
MSEMDELPATISIDSSDPVSLAKALQDIARHVQALHNDVGLLSYAIGILVNAGEEGHLAQPNATREILGLVIDQFGKQAPTSAAQLTAALAVPLGTPPPDGGTRLRIGQDEKKAA